MATSSPSPQARVLIADDEESSREALGQLLGLCNCTVRMARDGVEALEIAGEFQPDIVLLDIRMPRMNGIEACRRMRNGICDPKVVILAITGETRPAGSPEPFDGMLFKPVDFDRLCAILAGWSRRHGQGSLVVPTNAPLPISGSPATRIEPGRSRS